ncbi:MAG: flagellar basal body-associated FliL family protein [Nitrospirae bacterium]|nr:flagellar basal body-associated FliL family protein [Nitrospirota bacterium]
MAKDEKKPEEAPEGAVTPPPPKKRGNVLWIVVGVSVVLLGVGGFFGWKFFMGGEAGPGEEGSAKGAEAKKLAKPGPIVNLDPFLVNLADPGDSSHYLKVTIKLEVKGEEGSVEIGERMPQIRDAILVLLSSKTSEEIRTVEGKFQLRDEVISRANTFLAGKQVKAAYFTDFVMQ